MLLVKEIYCLAEGFPKSELYGLSSQLKRAAISIPSNLSLLVEVEKMLYSLMNSLSPKR